MKIYTREQLDKMGIFELRAAARDKGVKAPTMQTRDILADKILAIQSGAAPAVPPTGRGRPHCAFFPHYACLIF